ncbi:MAG: hypothetical protein ACFFFT_05525 [Candidatus Thorarchaeota archaeon]
MAQKDEMMQKQPIDLIVERIGDKLQFHIDPAALAQSGSCCNCNTDAISLEELGRLALDKLGPTARPK